MLRIIAGNKKGKKLIVPKSAKPLTDRIKMSIFDLIKDYVNNSFVLDLFAGSGNFAIEALSRGAKKAVIVENDPEALTCIKSNIANCDLKLMTDVIKADALNYLRSQSSLFNLIMLDPPFPIPEVNKKRLALEAIKRLDKDGLLIFRYPSTEQHDFNGVEASVVYLKKYGISKVAYIIKAEAN